MQNNVKVIKDVAIRDLSKIENNKGNIFHVIKSTDPFFKKFGECYISEVYPGKIKAWKKNSVKTQNLTVIKGSVKFVIFDDRENSITKNELNIFKIDRDKNYKLLTIPPNLWYGFCCVGDLNSLIINCADHPHNPEHIISLDIDNNLIPYDWK